MSYHGGKGNCHARIIGAMPLHSVYIETHLGGGAVMRAKRPARRQIGIDADDRVIAAWRRQDAPCELVHGDAVAFLSRYRFQGDELVYCDPPYPQECRDGRNRYRHEYTEDDHAQLLDLLVSLNCFVLISGQPTMLYRERLAGWRSTAFTAAARRGMRTEMLWANFAEPQRLHEPLKAAGGFRDRERVKRRLATMQSKFERMTEVERALFVDWLAETHPDKMREFARTTP